MNITGHLYAFAGAGGKDGAFIHEFIMNFYYGGDTKGEYYYHHFDASRSWTGEIIERIL